MKIAICIPVHGDTKAEWAISLAKLIYHTARHSDIELETLSAESSCVAANRSNLVLAAHQWGAESILWTDTDHVFPSDALLRLSAHDKAVVGTNYPRRMNASLPTASIKSGDHYQLLHTTKAKAEAGELEQVASMGLGLCLMKMDAVGSIEWPLFQQEMNGSKLKAGEDVFLFRKLEAVGIPVFVDHGLSWEVGHIATSIVTNADTRNQI